MSSADPNTQVEGAVLEEILDLHPNHLTREELVLKLSAARDDDGREAVRHAIRDLIDCGLLRYVDEVVAPTYPTLRIAFLLRRPRDRVANKRKSERG